jgi:hypothetical protein
MTNNERSSVSMTPPGCAKDGRLCHEQYRPPFDDIFNVSEPGCGTRVEESMPCSHFPELQERMAGLAASPAITDHRRR